MIYLCKPYFKHIIERFPIDFVHLVHKFSFGIILIEHIEPDNRLSSEHHKQYIIGKIL